MNDSLKIIIPASIALVGTLITVLIGYCQWKRQQEASRYASFVADQQAAYKGLWEQLEEVHIRLRKRHTTKREFDNLLHDVNAYILKHALYLDDHDRDLSNKYLEKIYELKDLVGESDDEDTKRSWAVSTEIPQSSIDEARKIGAIQNQANDLRKTIIEKCRKVIGGSVT